MYSIYLWIIHSEMLRIKYLFSLFFKWPEIMALCKTGHGNGDRFSVAEGAIANNVTFLK